MSSPEHLKNKNRYFTAVAIGIASLTLVGCADKPIQTHEGLTDLENNARTEAHQIFETLEPKDIVECQATSVTAGPEASYMSKRRPSINVGIQIGPGDKYSDPLLSDDGMTVGNYNAEVTWWAPTIVPEHRLDENWTKALSGGSVLEQNFDTKKEIRVMPRTGVPKIGMVNNDNIKDINVIIPINNDLVGKRDVKIIASTNPVKLREDYPGMPIDQPVLEKDLDKNCGIIRLNVHEDGSVELLSAVDSNGKELKLN